MNVLVLSNAGGKSRRRRLASVREALPESDSVRHRATEVPAQVGELVGHDRWTPDDLLVINGGDGSAQLALTELLTHCPPERLPRVACLPGGTTNMTAFDLNRHRGFKDCLAALHREVAAGAPAATRRQPVVQVERAGKAPLCGLFFGAGTIVQGIEYFHQRVHPAGGRHELGAGVAMARALWGIARRQPPFAEPLAVQVEGLVTWRRSGATAVRVLLVTALERLFLGLRPYWGTGAGALEATVVEGSARGFLRSIPRLLRGRPSSAMAPGNGWHSERVDGLTLHFEGGFTLDGELFHSSGDKMRVSTSHPVRFVPL